LTSSKALLKNNGAIVVQNAHKIGTNITTLPEDLFLWSEAKFLLFNLSIVLNGSSREKKQKVNKNMQNLCIFWFYAVFS
jgi:hypothetical protein